MNQLGTVYATKRRRRNGKSLKPSPKESSGKSNPSKRHRERLNAELDTLASLLPYEASILSKLDRLSILRLSVSYLRTKSYFQVSCHKGIKGEQQQHQQHGGGHFLLHDNQFRNRDVTIFDSPSLDGESFLQALNGFLLILTSDGEVFFATHTIESYLGFHQSDVVHQSVYELVHSEDREELQRQLTWSSQLAADSGLTLLDALRPDNSMILERSFTVRFRCLLDNTSGFLRLDIRGRVKVLHGQNRKMEEPPLALFAICTPFGPPSLLELPHKESMFKSKHRLDLALVSMDQRGKALLGHSDAELSSLGGYDLVHFDDLSYVASAHQELLKTGASGLIAYRLQTKDGQFQWLQTSSRLVYKNSKPDFIISTHRPLMEEEGRDLMGKRTMDFKVSYLDAGLTSNYFTDQEAGSAISAVSTTVAAPTTTTSITTGQTVLPSHAAAATAHPPGTQKIGRKYKNQLRDFLSNCRTKRKSGSVGCTSTGGVVGNGLATPPEPSPVHYLSASSNSVELAGGAGWTTAVGGGGAGSAAASSAAASAAVAAAATAYSPSVYPGASVAAAAAAAATVPYHADATNSFYHSAMHHHHHHQLAAHHHHAHHQPNATLQNLQNLHQSFYGSPAALDHNRFGIGVVPTVAAEHNLFHHGHAAYARGLGVGAAGYYAADYSPYVHAAAAATTNGFLTAGYDSTIGGMSQLYGGSSNSSPAGGGGGGGSPSAVESKYVSSASTSTTGGGVSSLGRLTSLHHHHHLNNNNNHHHQAGGGGGGGAGLGLLSSGETEPSSESSGTSTSSMAGGDSPYNNGHHNTNNHPHHHHHQQQQQQQQRNNLGSASRPNSRKAIDQQQQQQQQQQMMQQQQQQLLKLDKYGGDGRDSSGGTSSSGSSTASGVYPGGTSNSNDTRQTVLMWGSSGLTPLGANNNSNSSAANDDSGGGGNGVVVSMTTADLITSTTAAAVAAAYAADCGVSETGIGKTKYGTHHGYNGHHQQQQQHSHHVQQQQQQQHDGAVSKASNGVGNNSSNSSNNNLESNGGSLNSACKWGRVGPHYLYGAAAAASAAEVAGSTEVSWPPHHHHPTAPHHHHHPHQYYPYPYHHHAHHHHHQSPHQLNF